MAFNTSKIYSKPAYMWKLNKSLFNDNLVMEEIKEEMKDFLDFNEYNDTSYPMKQMKAMLIGKFIALSVLERSYTNNLTAYLRALEQKEANTPKRSRRQ